MVQITPEILQKDLPTFEVMAKGGPYKYPRRSDGIRPPDGCSLVFTCPKCKKEQSHGGMYNQKGAGDGHRVSHCRCWPDGYYLKEV